MASGGIGGSLSSATDVQFNNPTNGEVLKRNNGLWVNSPLASTTISDFTEATQDIISATIQAGTNITVNYDDNTGTLTIDTAANQKLSGFYNVKDFKCDDGQYVKGDGTHDDTTGIQRALDTATGSLFFPTGIYRITSGLTLTRNIDLIGFSKRNSVIRGDGFSATTDLLTIAITENWGYLDVRNWRIENLALSLNAGGRHALYISGGMQILGSKIENCGLAGNMANGGYGLMIQDNFAHGRITQNAFDSIYLACYDANLIDKNLFFGNRVAVTFNIINGIRNNVLRDNTAVNRDGTVHIINGSNIRIHNNQFEHMAGQGTNQSLYSAMVWLQGADRTCTNIVISENNFGGGTNLNRSVYVDNANKTIIEKNHFVAVNTADIELTALSKNAIIKSDNTTLTQVVNPRPDTLLSVKVIDNGLGTVGVLKTLTTQNGWTSGSVLKDESGIVHFYDAIGGGTMTTGTVMMTLPKFFRPKANSNILAISDGGVQHLQHTSNGTIVAKNITDNINLQIMAFAASEDVDTNLNIIASDTFTRSNTTNLGITETGQAWQVNNNNLQVLDGAVSLMSSSPADIATIDSGLSDCSVYATFKSIPATFTKTCKLVFRYVDANNYLYLTAFDLSGYVYSIFKVVGGVETRVWGTNQGAYASGDNVRVTLSGQNVAFDLNGTRITQQTINDFLTATRYGLGLASTTASKIDDFKVAA